MEQYKLPLENEGQELSLEERYKTLIGQAPRPGTLPADIERALENPEEERLRVLRENEEEDRQDPTFFPKKSS